MFGAHRAIAEPNVHAALAILSLCLAWSGPLGFRTGKRRAGSFQRNRIPYPAAPLLQKPGRLCLTNSSGILPAWKDTTCSASSRPISRIMLAPSHLCRRPCNSIPDRPKHTIISATYILRNSKPAPAEQEFRAVLHLDPANSEANYNLGVLLMMKNSPAAAIPHFERVHPATTASQFNLVRAYLQTGRTADALRVAAQLSDQAKADVQVHFSLGVLLAAEKQYKLAQLELEKADALQPETFEILYNLGQVLLRSR